MILIEQLILFLNLLFGSIFVYRIIKKLMLTTYFRKEKLTKIGIVIFCFYFVLIIVFLNSYWVYLVQLFLCLFIKKLIHSYLLFYLESLYWKEFPRFLTHVMLRIQMGESFRSAINRCLSLCSTEFRHILSRIMEVVVFSQHKADTKAPIFINDIIKEFKKIDRSPHLATTLLQHKYDSLIMKKNFRHKSGQVLLQTHIQTAVLFLLYVLTLVYVHYSYSLYNYLKLLITSIFLMLIGFVFLHLLTRSFKWSE